MTDRLRQSAFGMKKMTLLDRFGTWLSRRAILKYSPPGDGLNILELGCGYEARNLLAIADKAKSIVGIDIAINQQINSHPKFKGIEGDINKVTRQLGNQKFDLILIISVLEHLENPVDILGLCRDLLNPGGVVLVNVPTWIGKFYLEYAAFRLKLSPKEEMDDHKMYYDKKDLWPILVKAGFLPSKISLSYHKFNLNLFAIIKK